mmetsp:Transcript_11661/g.38693  ORF Transcript_11661/g.38693 Transcript_11661/m.38693 type:complete len:289 (-) Transcript_11661:348-1214(-)
MEWRLVTGPPVAPTAAPVRVAPAVDSSSGELCAERSGFGFSETYPSRPTPFPCPPVDPGRLKKLAPNTSPGPFRTPGFFSSPKSPNKSEGRENALMACDPARADNDAPKAFGSNRAALTLNPLLNPCVLCPSPPRWGASTNPLPLEVIAKVGAPLSGCAKYTSPPPKPKPSPAERAGGASTAEAGTLAGVSPDPVPSSLSRHGLTRNSAPRNACDDRASARCAASAPPGLANPRNAYPAPDKEGALRGACECRNGRGLQNASAPNREKWFHRSSTRSGVAFEGTLHVT